MSRQHDNEAKRAFYKIFRKSVGPAILHNASYFQNEQQRKPQQLRKKQREPRDIPEKVKHAPPGHIFDEKCRPCISAIHECKDVFTTQDVINEINKAREQRKIVRARGWEHSGVDHVLDDNEAGILLSLKGDLEKVTIHREQSTDEKMYVTAGGGCVLGYNPNIENIRSSLSYQVNRAGFALPNLSSITHQTVAGFFSTGSAGGSLQYNMADSIEAITFINGKREEQHCSRTINSDLFYAVGVSMGLFGVITAVTFCLKDKRFNVKGSEKYVEFKDSALANPYELKNLDSYWRFNLYPQKYVKKVMEWTAERSEYNEEGKPYENIINRPLVAVGAAGVMITCNTLLYNYPGEKTYKIIGGAMGTLINPHDSSQLFNDVWYHGLPKDNRAHVDDILEVDYTEIWIPFKHRTEVIERLKEIYNDSEAGQQAAGNYAVEIYAAKSSKFWLSMSYDEDMIRVDPYWYLYNPCGTAREFFTFVWNQLLPMMSKSTPVRLHWGKFLPQPGQELQDMNGNSVVFNSEYLESVYPKMRDWKELRQEHDPNQMFVTNYWREILDIPLH